MTTAATSLLGLALPVTGELSGTWGDTVNNSITSLLDSAIAGTTTLTTDADVTLTTTTLATNQARQAIILWTASGTVTRNITAPAQSKIYTVINATGSTQSIVIRGAGPTTGVTIPAGQTATVAWNGSDFVDASNYINGNLKINGSVTLTAGTANGVAYLNGSKVLTTGSALVFDGSNLGLGVTPSTYSTGKVVEVGYAGNAFWGYSANTNLVTQNANLVAGTFKYSSTNPASYYQQSASVHSWGIAPSGTAGNAISFTQAMTLDASGNLGVGATSPNRKLDVDGSIQSRNTSSNLSYLYFASYADPTSSYSFVAGDGRSTGYLGFHTNNTERARIDSSGNLLVGVTSYSAGVRGKQINSDNYNSSWDSTNSRTHMQFMNPNGTVGSITTSASSTTYATSSDYRLKNTIEPMTGALSRVAALKPVTYKWNADGSDGEGFIAHELAEVCPDAVVGEKDAVDGDGSPKYQGIDTSFLVATLTAAIQEQQALITSLTARITALEA